MAASFLVPVGDTEAEIRQEAAAAAAGISSSRLDHLRAPPTPPIRVSRASPPTAPKPTKVAMATVDRGGEEVKGQRITGPIR